MFPVVLPEHFVNRGVIYLFSGWENRYSKEFSNSFVITRQWKVGRTIQCYALFFCTCDPLSKNYLEYDLEYTCM